MCVIFILYVKLFCSKAHKNATFYVYDKNYKCIKSFNQPRWKWGRYYTYFIINTTYILLYFSIAFNRLKCKKKNVTNLCIYLFYIFFILNIIETVCVYVRLNICIIFYYLKKSRNSFYFWVSKIGIEETGKISTDINRNMNRRDCGWMNYI